MHKEIEQPKHNENIILIWLTLIPISLALIFIISSKIAAFIPYSFFKKAETVNIVFAIIYPGIDIGISVLKTS